MIQRVLEYLTIERSLLYHPSTLIRNVQRVNGQCEVTDHQGHVYAAEKVILCNGSEFKLLYPELFEKSDLEVTKLQMLQTVPNRGLSVKGNILTGLSIRRYESFQECPSYTAIKQKEDDSALWKKWGVHILFKQSPDGSFIIGDSHEYADVAHIDTLGFDLRWEINEYILQEAQRIFKLVDWRIQKAWYGIYSQCKTSDIFQQTIDQNIHIVTGIGGKGMTGSPGFAASNLNRILGIE